MKIGDNGENGELYYIYIIQLYKKKKSVSFYNHEKKTAKHFWLLYILITEPLKFRYESLHIAEFTG